MSGLGAEEDQSQRVNQCSDSAEAVWKQCVVGGARCRTGEPVDALVVQNQSGKRVIR